MNSQSSEATLVVANKVKDVVLEAVKEAGHEAIGDGQVEDELKKMAYSCESQMCLQTLGSNLEADEVIFVKIVDDGQTSFKTSIVLANRDGDEDERTAGFFVVLEWLKSTLATTLSREKIVSALAVDTAVLEADQASNVEGLGETKGPNEEIQTDGFKKLDKKAFIISASITGVFAIGFGITDIVVHSKYNNLKDSGTTATDWENRRKSATNLQIVDRVLLGFTAAGVATTAVLFFLTDFKKETDEENKNEASGSIVPVAINGGGMLVINGSF